MPVRSRSSAATPGCGDLGRVDHRQGAPRPAAAPPCTTQHPAVRLRRPQGLLDARAPGGAARARRLPASPAQLRAGARGPGPAVLKAARWPAASSPTSPRATTRCWCGCASSRAIRASTASSARSGSKASISARPGLTRGGAPALQALRQRDAPGSRRLRALAEAAAATVVVADAAMAELSALDSPAPLGFRRALAGVAGDPRRCAPASSSTGCRTPATSARSCAAPRPSASPR